MSHGTWGRSREREVRQFYEKLFRRAPFPPWDERWHRLSLPARSSLLHDVKPPSRYQSTYGGGTSSSISAEKLPAQVLGELTSAGFLEVSPVSGKKAADRVSLVADAIEFFSRIR